MYTIMIIDDDITNLSIAKSILEKHYEIIPIISGEKALYLLNKGKILPSLILLDIDMPNMNGYQVIEQLKSNPSLCSIPVIFLTSEDRSDDEIVGLSLGAVDYISKPFTAPLILRRVELHIKILEQRSKLEDYSDNLEQMIQQKTNMIWELQYTIISIVSSLINKRDHFTGGHVERVSKYMYILLKEVVNEGLGEDITPKYVGILALCSKLHDVGKIGVPDSILLKPGNLDDEEREFIKCHTSIGAEAIKESVMIKEENDFLRYTLDMVRSHHEKWDGSGYPEGLKGKEIPLTARILAVADVYDAITSQRVYKKADTHENAVKIIADGSGSQFDPEIIDIFIKVQGELKKILNRVHGKVKTSVNVVK